MGQELKLWVPTYYGTANCKQNTVGDPPDFDEPIVPVLVHEAEGVRIVLGTHDINDRDNPDIQIERRPKGWAIFLHPIGGCDASGYVYFLDDGRSFLLREQEWASEGSIEVLRGGGAPPELDEIKLPRPVIVGPEFVDSPASNTSDIVSAARRKPTENRQLAPKKRCARCEQLVETCDDWYGDLCPGCADQTDGDWVCSICGRRGLFEDMGGEGDTDPECCGNPCQRLDEDDVQDEGDESP